jgi:hypothetical protein
VICEPPRRRVTSVAGGTVVICSHVRNETGSGDVGVLAGAVSRDAVDEAVAVPTRAIHRDLRLGNALLARCVRRTRCRNSLWTNPPRRQPASFTPPLVRLHAASTTSAMWRPIIATMSSSYRCYCIDTITEATKSVATKRIYTIADHTDWGQRVGARTWPPGPRPRPPGGRAGQRCRRSLRHGRAASQTSADRAAPPDAAPPP